MRIIDTELRKKKLAATKREMKRVFDNMNAPGDIVVAHNGSIYIRDLWRNVNNFGWSKWKKAL